MLQQPPKVIIALAAVFVAIISGLAYLIFSFMPFNANNRSSIEGAIEGSAQSELEASKTTYCGGKTFEEIPQCCSEWLATQPNVIIPNSCTPKWSLDASKNCVYTCSQPTDVMPL